MNGLGANAPADGCFHCGESLPAHPATAMLDGAPRAFCCTGCAAAAEWIRQSDLGDYYSLRDKPATRVGTEAVDFSAWDRSDVQAGHAHPIPGGMEITVLTDGMHCAACAWLIDRAITREPGALEVAANAVTGRVRLRWDPQRAPLSRLLTRMAALGYRPFLATGEDRERARRRERNRWLLRIGLSGLVSMQAMMMAEALYLDTGNTMAPATRDFLRWITFLLSTPVVFWAGWPFLSGMLRELSLRRLGMDTLVATSILLAYAASVWETVRGGPHVWYDAAVMFVFLLLCARMLEQRARTVASAQVDAMARAFPALAVRETGDGGREQVPVAHLQSGDVLRVAIGDTVPADGVLLDEAAAFEEALLTGEALPVHKQPGDAVLAGSLCREHPARVRIARTGADTRLSQLVRLVEKAQEQRPAIAALADRVAAWFVPALLLATLAIYLWWRVHDPQRAFEVALATLVISCPCALSLAIPAAMAVAHGALSRLGVLATGRDALERLADVDVVLFDKTGTLTDGAPHREAVQLQGGDLDEAAALRIVAALEREAGHPLQQAFLDVDVDSLPQASDLRLHAGRGIEGVVEGRRWFLGQAGFAGNGEDDGALWLGDGTQLLARFVIREQARADAAAALQRLRADGISIELSSGDGEGPVRVLADTLGIDSVLWRQSPEDKLAHMRALQRQGHVVAMVGDGVNDAPVLAGADVSLAMGSGAALAQQAADCVLTGQSLLRVPQAIALARRTRRIVRENLAWALAYNIIALPLAATGKVTPWMAAIGMAVSSLIVTLNALRLARRPD